MSGSARSAEPSGRFPSRFRVRKRPEFLAIQERGQRVSTPSFVLILNVSTSADSPRLGITASRRVGNAVVRTRAKRLVREAFRATRELWPKGVDLVVIVKRAPGESKLVNVVSEWHAVRPQIERRIRTLLGSATEKPAPRA